LTEDSRVEGTSHSSEGKLGAEREVWVGATGLGQGIRGDANKVFASIWTNGWIDGKVYFTSGRDVDASWKDDGLEEGLLLSTTSVEGNSAVALLSKSGHSAIISPRNDAGLTACASSGSDGTGHGKDSQRGRRRGDEGGKELDDG